MIEALWQAGQESSATTITRSATVTEIGLAGGRYKIVVSHGQRVWKSKDGQCPIDPNTPMWDAVDSILELSQ